MRHVATKPNEVQPDCTVEEPFYGWRYLQVPQPDGSTRVAEIPLTYEDLLYPEEGDDVVQEPWHTRDFIYCQSTLEAWAASQPQVVVLGDCRVDWGVAGVRPLGPDILVLFNVRQWLQRATYRLAEDGGEPVLLIEIASPSTREHDLDTKMKLYYRLGVQKYVIIDRGPQGTDPVRLLGYQRGSRGWRQLRANADGRLDLAPVGWHLGIAEGRPWLYDAVTGARALERREWDQALAAAEARAQAEAQARAALEARLRELEAQLRQQRE